MKAIHVLKVMSAKDQDHVAQSLQKLSMGHRKLINRKFVGTKGLKLMLNKRAILNVKHWKGWQVH